MATGNLDAKQLSTMKKEELIALATDMGLDTSEAKTKADYIALITAEPVEVEEPETEKSAENAADLTEKSAENEEKSPDKSDDAVLAALKAQNEALQKQMELLQAQLNEMARPQVIQVAADTERVHFLWMAEVADYNLVTFGPGGMYGSITGKTGTFSVPKNELSRILDDRNRRFLQKRWLIAVDGLTDEERESLGVAYREGEILDRRAFERMVNIPGDEICAIYKNLCKTHREMVGKRFYEAWIARNENVTRDKVLALRNLTRRVEPDIKAFQQILKEMNASEEEEE